MALRFAFARIVAKGEKKTVAFCEGEILNKPKTNKCSPFIAHSVAWLVGHS